jgi:hypothetical protein
MTITSSHFVYGLAFESGEPDWRPGDVLLARRAI